MSKTRFKILIVLISSLFIFSVSVVAEEATEEEMTTLRDADEDLFSIEKLFGTNDNQSQIRFAEDIDELKNKSNTNKKSNK